MATANRTCSIEDCERPHEGRGWCNMHWKRWRRYGDPALSFSNIRPTAETHFWAKVNKDGPVPDYAPHLGPCWLWAGAGVGTAGYGGTKIAGRHVRAHRFSYESLVGPIPQGLTLDHLCRVRRCVNPAHLEPVTHLENVRRGSIARKTHCVHGHPFDLINTIWSSKQRRCRTCQDARTARRREERNGTP